MHEKPVVAPMISPRYRRPRGREVLYSPVVRCLIDGVAAARGGGGLTRITELLRDLPSLRPESQFLFALHPDVVALEPEIAANRLIWCLPAKARSTPARLAWEWTVLPWRSRCYQPDVVFSPFNILPMRGWGRPRPALAVMVSNLAPYSEVCRRYANAGDRRRNRLLRRMTNIAVREADLVLLQSEQAYDLISEPGLLEKGVVVPQAPPKRHIDVAVPRALPWPYFAIVSDLYKFKGIETAITALASRSHQDVRLLVIGRAIEPDYAIALKQLVAALNLGSRVVFSDFLPHAEVLQRLAHAEACLLTSRFENHSRIPTEAMALGCPVIAADTPSAREACGPAAVYYSPDDHDLLSGLMSRVRSDAVQRRELVHAGDELVATLQGASGPAVAVQLLEELAKRGRGKTAREVFQ